MAACRVVELKVFLESGSGFSDGQIGFQIDVLILHRSPQTFCEDVVKAPASAIHADLNLTEP